jgi:hypothetical protein
MQEIKAENGGRPFVNDDILLLQRELTAAVQAQFLGRGAFILSGCRVSGPATGATITPGIVCLDGQLLRYYGQSNAQLPAQLQASPWVLSDPRPYQTGGTKNCQQEKPAVLVASNPAYTGGEFLVLDTWGGKTWDHVQRALVRVPSEVGWVAAATLGNYDPAGVGLPGTEAWGWALLNGQSSRLSLSGRVAVGLDPSRPDYDTIGKQAGAESVGLTADNNGPHNHAPAGAFDFNQLLRKADYGKNTTASDPDGNGNGNGGEPDVVNSAPIQTSGSGTPHENRMPFTTLLARVWVGY